jgi:formate hydrogenlyase subunit 6/NADH:ubiquinone oxidoreductase subunit I
MKQKPGKMVVEVLKASVQKPATIPYPFVRIEMPDRFRGRLRFQPERCIGCKACVRDCPADAIHIDKVGDKRFDCRFDLDKCIYCAQCVDSCPKDALEATREFELAQLDRKRLKVVTHAPPAPPAPATPAPAGADKTAG